MVTYLENLFMLILIFWGSRLAMGCLEIGIKNRESVVVTALEGKYNSSILQCWPKTWQQNIRGKSLASWLERMKLLVITGKGIRISCKIPRFYNKLVLSLPVYQSHINVTFGIMTK